MEFYPVSYAPDFSRLVPRGRNVFSLGDSGRWHFSFLPPNNVREMQFIDVYNVIRNGKKERNFDLQGILLLAVFDRRLGANGIFRIIYSLAPAKKSSVLWQNHVLDHQYHFYDQLWPFVFFRKKTQFF